MTGVGNGDSDRAAARRVATGLVEVYGQRALEKAQSLARESGTPHFARLVCEEVEILLAEAGGES